MHRSTPLLRSGPGRGRADPVHERLQRQAAAGELPGRHSEPRGRAGVRFAVLPHARLGELTLELVDERRDGVVDLLGEIAVGTDDELGHEAAAPAGDDLVAVVGGECDREEGHDDAQQRSLRQAEEQSELVVEGGEMDGVDESRHEPEEDPHRQRRADVEREHGEEPVPRFLLSEEVGELRGEPQGHERAGDDPGDPCQLPDHPLEVAEQGGDGEEADHHQVVSLDGHVRSPRQRWGRSLGRACFGPARRGWECRDDGAGDEGHLPRESLVSSAATGAGGAAGFSTGSWGTVWRKWRGRRGCIAWVECGSWGFWVD